MFRVRVGKVVEAGNSFDFFKMFQQMGVVELADAGDEKYCEPDPFNSPLIQSVSVLVGIAVPLFAIPIPPMRSAAMFRIEGLDKLSQNLEEAQKAIAAMDGEIGSVSCDPHDPASIEAAIQKMESLIDERLEPYASNPIVGPMIESMKEQYRKGILDKAASVRIEGAQENGE